MPGANRKAEASKPRQPETNGFDYDKVDFFAQWSALGYRHLVTFNGCDARWVMGKDFAAPSLVPTVLRVVVKIISLYRDSPGSLGGCYYALEYSSSD